MEYKINDFHYNIPEQELLDDLKRVANELAQYSLSSRQYDEMGRFNSGTIHRRFGTWNKALKKAGLETYREKNVSEKDLFDNIERVWLALGRQPTFREMRQPLSKYSTYPYSRRFGAFRKALMVFVEFISSEKGQTEELKAIDENTTESPVESEQIYKHKTKRLPSERLKVQVLMRDGNRCRLCGITLTGDNIHFDHILPWSKGGETVLENLQILCAPHNLAKGDL